MYWNNETVFWPYFAFEWDVTYILLFLADREGTTAASSRWASPSTGMSAGPLIYIVNFYQEPICIIK